MIELAPLLEDCLRRRRKGHVYSPNRGGRREPGPGKKIGKPRSPEPLVRRTVTLPAHIIEALKELGDGNVSEGVRELYKRYAGAEPACAEQEGEEPSEGDSPPEP